MNLHAKKNRSIKETVDVITLMFSCSVTSESLWPQEPQHTGFPVLHHLQFTQIQVHWVCDAIQPAHSLPPHSPFAFKFPSISIFPSELALCIRWPKYWKFTFSISPSTKYSGLTSFRIDWCDLAVQGTLKSLSAPQFKGISSLVFSLFYCTWLLEKQ